MHQICLQTEQQSILMVRYWREWHQLRLDVCRSHLLISFPILSRTWLCSRMSLSSPNSSRRYSKLFQQIHYTVMAYETKVFIIYYCITESSATRVFNWDCDHAKLMSGWGEVLVSPRSKEIKMQYEDASLPFIQSFDLSFAEEERPIPLIKGHRTLLWLDCSQWSFIMLNCAFLALIWPFGSWCYSFCTIYQEPRVRKTFGVANYRS